MNRFISLTTKSLLRSSTPRATRFVVAPFARAYSTPPTSGFDRPSPPSLGRQEQKDFDELVRRVNAPASKGGIELEGDEADEAVMHPQFRQKPRAKFEGETNPETGEVGGPKHEPLAHGQSFQSRLAALGRVSFATGAIEPNRRSIDKFHQFNH